MAAQHELPSVLGTEAGQPDGQLPPTPEYKVYPDPREFFDGVFARLDTIEWVDDERSFEEVSADVLELATETTRFYQQITPGSVLENQEFWLAGMDPTMRTDVVRLLENFTSIEQRHKRDYPLETWNKAFQVPAGGFWDMFIKSVFTGDEFKLSEDLREMYNSDYQQLTVLPMIPLYSYFRSVWRERFQDLTSSETQAKYIQFIYHIGNPFLEESRILDTTIDFLYKEWQETQFEGKEPESGQWPQLRDKIVKGLSEMGLAAISAKSAWAYIGQELPDKFLNYLLRIDNRLNSMRLFNDLLGLAQKGALLYPPQLYYLYNKFLASTSRADNLSLRQALDDLYARGGRLCDYADRLNFIVTGDQRSDELQAVIDKLLSHIDRTGKFVSWCSGPVNDALLRYLKWGMQGKIYTFDMADQKDLLARALALPDELTANTKPYDVESLRQRIIELIRQIGVAYPLGQDGQWLYHIVAKLPDDALSEQFIREGDVALGINQRGNILYSQTGEQLHEIYNELRTISQNPGSVYILTRGVVDRLIVDLGFVRETGGRFSLAYWDRTDSAYPFNSIVESFLNGVINEEKVRTDGGDDQLLPLDKRRSGSGEFMVEVILDLLYSRYGYYEIYIDLAKNLEGKIYPTIINKSNIIFSEPFVDIGKEELGLLFGAVLNAHGINTGPLGILSVLTSRENIQALKNAGMWNDFVERVRRNFHDKDFRPDPVKDERFGTELFRPDLLAWCLKHKPELIPEIIRYLDERLPFYLHPYRTTLQTLRSAYRMFDKKYNLIFYDYFRNFRGDIDRYNTAEPVNEPPNYDIGYT